MNEERPQLAAENALTGVGNVYDLSALPRVTLSDPQLASVGLTEAEARSKGLDIETAVLPLEHVPRAQASRNTNGLFKLIRERGSTRLIGAHVLAVQGVGYGVNRCCVQAYGRYIESGTNHWCQCPCGGRTCGNGTVLRSMTNE